tara:strand:- start:3433 stop:3717 length:285 start_codon:yes stop_codon:yes gene_type:complete
MRLRRYYKKGVKYKYTISEKYLSYLIERYGDEKAARIDNASFEIILESIEEEKAWLEDCCARIIANTRWYLDNLDKLPTFTIHKKALFPKKIKK